MTGFGYPRLFAHRGGGALAPENTLAGIRLAARLGYRGVEFDVMLSEDGIPLLIHDESLARTTDGRGAVASTSYAELSRLDAGSWFHPTFSGESIPRLEDALACCARFGLVANVEIKPAAGRDDATGRVVGNSVASGEPGAVLLSSFSEPALAAARLTAPAVPRALLFEAPPADWQRQLSGLDCLALHCAAQHLSPDLAVTLRAAGIPFACYTVNDRVTAAQLFAAGAAALFTDRLDLFDPRNPDGP